MATTPNHYIVILCGGTGPRLWPLSRAYHPKQFLKILGKKSLLEQTISRAQKIVSSKRIFVISNYRYNPILEKYVAKKVPRQNIIYEPAKKNTAMAILLATCLIKKNDPNAVITTMASDHFIKKTLSFTKTIKQAFNISTRHLQIVAIGIKPAFPNPSFGYIIPQKKNQNLSHINLFIEKPDAETAQTLIKKGAFWNSGIYTFPCHFLIQEFQNLQPEFKKTIDKLLQTKDFTKIINNVYQNAPEISIERALFEKSNNLLVIPIKSDWSDVGEWKSIYQHLDKDKSGISKLNSETEFLEVNSKNCLLSGLKNKLVGLVDVENLAIIDTPDGLLICNIKNDGSSRVREIVSQIVKNKKYQKYFLKKNEK
jgi:mannose-1-phosphate guanylyltransferase